MIEPKFFSTYWARNAASDTWLLIILPRGRGTGEAGEARASPEFRGFTTEKFLAS